MQNRFFTRNLLLFLLTTCFALSLQKPSNFENNDIRHGQKSNEVLLRVKRAGHKPGFFRTLFSVIYEQYNDTKNTINTVNTMLNENFLPENAPVTQATTVSSDPNISTTQAPYRITRSEFNRILQRNLRGLVRLYNLELADALAQSKKTQAEFRKNASIEVSKYL